MSETKLECPHCDGFGKVATRSVTQSELVELAEEPQEQVRREMLRKFVLLDDCQRCGGTGEFQGYLLPKAEDWLEEIWLLWNPICGSFVLPIDDPPSGRPFLASGSEAEAKVLAEYQWECYQVKCIPMRWKEPGGDD